METAGALLEALRPQSSSQAWLGVIGTLGGTILGWFLSLVHLHLQERRQRARSALACLVTLRQLLAELRSRGTAGTKTYSSLARAAEVYLQSFLAIGSHRQEHLEIYESIVGLNKGADERQVHEVCRRLEAHIGLT